MAENKDKLAKLEAKYDKAYDRKDALAEQIESLRKDILNEPDQKKKNKLRSKRDALINERDSIIITEDTVKIPMAPKTKKIITAVIAIIVVIALLFAYVATGFVRKGMAATLGWPQKTFTAYTLTDADGEKHDIKVNTYNYYFALYYNNLQSTVSSYKQYGIDLDEANMNVDFDKKLSEQTRTQDGKTTTWLEYVQEQVEDSIKDTYASYYKAVKENKGKDPEITDDQKKEIKEALKNYKESAHKYGYTVSGYIEAAMGHGVTKDVFVREATISYIAENYDSDHKNDSDSKTYTDKELNAYKKKNESKLQSVDIKMFECDSEDDAKAFKKALKADGSNFAALASKYSSDDFDKKANKNSQETTYNDMARSTMEGLSVAISTADDDKKYPGLDWLYSSDRKAGDVRQDSTTVVYVVKPVYMSDAKTVNVRHILIAPESSKSSDDSSSSKSAKDCTDKEWAAAEKKAKSILAKYNSGDKTSKSFAKLAKSNSSDGNASDGGLYENIIPNQMVPTFNAWCFDSSRKAGDVGIVKTEYGYHIMYFEGKNDQAVWKYIAQQKLAADDTQKEHDSITLKKNWFGSRYLEIDTDIDA
ncbi:peptidylprolyl isomerase [uncultured Eubacterium sp.]|uniref:peptidylprolyl isomerase n=1 Tax=uncultured Eubacterium sp. TaxID=165185 RepID=UPI0025EDC44D|nr:peptidylprolyl isomerase [uncultured Eubacterium sp.]